jgi:3'-5' exoribonuclease
MGDRVAKKRVNVSDLVEGLSVEETYLVREASMRETRAGKNYIAAKLSDSTGTITTRMWDAQASDAAGFKSGAFVAVRGHVESYQGSPQLIVDNFRPVNSDDVSVEAFLPATPKDLGELEEALASLVKSVKDKPLRALLGAFFEDNDFAARFRRVPAAAEFHHAYVGGLLEHTVAVATTAVGVAEGRPDELDRDLLVAGALLHDVGKAYELGAGPDMGYTDAGRLIGHIVMGCLEAEKRMGGIKGFPTETRRQVLHLIVSHHGQREFGSPVLPATPEALALHHIDNLDAKIRAAADARPQPGDDAWSDYMRMLGVRVYQRKRPD